jgi:RNA polymerase sigma factor (sigma-70 family)
MPLSDEQAALAGENLGLAVFIARRLHRSCAAVRRLGLDQAISAAQLGLLQAAGRYDPARGLPFSALASVSVRRAILRAVALWCRGPQPRSLDVCDDAGRSWYEILADRADGQSCAADVRDVIDRLPEHQRCVVTRRLQGASLAEIARETGLTKQAVNARERAAYRALRRVLA